MWPLKFRNTSTKMFDDVTSINGLPVRQQSDLLAGPTDVSVDNTSTGKTLATLLGVALDSNLRVLTLIPAATGICWANGSASASSSPLPVGVLELRCTKAAADTRKFFAATTTKMTVLQEG